MQQAFKNYFKLANRIHENAKNLLPQAISRDWVAIPIIDIVINYIILFIYN